MLIVFISLPLSINAESTVLDETVQEESDLSAGGDGGDVVSPNEAGGGEINGEDWYDIAPDGIHPQLSHAVDYSVMPELLTYVKPGDLLYERNGTLLGDILHHIAIVVGVVYDDTYDQYYVLLLEAVEDGVTYGLLSPARFEEKAGHYF